jgi:16S rRNA (guanine527-N7)-methyltransferase
MEEEAAIAALDVPRETIERLEAFAALLRAENKVQNLVSHSSLDHLWARHIYDSAQLLRFAPQGASYWLDLGTGAGFPGLVTALLHPAHFTLVEARKLRVDFLNRAAEVLGLEDRVSIHCLRVEALPQRTYDSISARAFAPLPRLLELGDRFSTAKTRWILPKGRNARSELDAALRSWQGSFRLEPSLTDPEAQIIVAEGVKRKRSK